MNDSTGTEARTRWPLWVRLTLAALPVLLMLGAFLAWPLFLTHMPFGEWVWLMKALGVTALLGFVVCWPFWLFPDWGEMPRRPWLWGFVAGAAWAIPITAFVAWYVWKAR